MGLFRRFLFWCKNNRTYRISIPKEQTLCYSENRIADVTKIDAMRPRNFPAKRRAKIAKRTRLLVIPSIPSILLSGAELTEYYSVHFGIRVGPKRTHPVTANSVYSHSGIVPNEHALNIYAFIDCAFARILRACSLCFCVLC